MSKRINRDDWSPIAGYEGLYEVSSAGQVRRVGRRILKDQLSGPGYRKVVLCRSNVARPHLVHRLVAAAFLPADSSRPHVNHIDGSRDNNDISNLEWCTQSENLQHAASLGRMTHNRGEGCGTAQLTEEDVHWVRLWLDQGYSCASVSRAFSVSYSAISHIKHGTTWRHLERREA